MNKQQRLDLMKEWTLDLLAMPIERHKEIGFLTDAHPIIESVIFFDEDKISDIVDDENAREIVLEKSRRAITRCEDPEELLYTIRSPYYLTAVKNWEHLLTEKEFAKLLKIAWTHEENPNQDINVSIKEAASLFSHANKNYLMNSKEQSYYANLPEELIVYRGVSQGRNPNGLSWTSNYETAKWFANRFDKKGVIYEAHIKKSEILAYFNERGEDEIVVLPKRKKIIE